MYIMQYICMYTCTCIYTHCTRTYMYIHVYLSPGDWLYVYSQL